MSDPAQQIPPDYREVPISGGRTVSIPQTWATEGYSLGMYNFSGPGWNSSEGGMAARPVETFDFASKLHDLHYCISKIGFKTEGEHADDVEAGRGSARDRSHQHKADLIFRIMVEHTDNSGFGPYYSRTRFIHEQTQYAMADDGFVNILNEPNLIEVLKEYRMMPWSELPESSQPRHRRDWFERNVHGPRNYAEPVPEDQRWYEWAKEFYAPIWGRALAVR
ncbi:MAG: hypothetical protein KDK70_00720 [Myxococcales bacterium]|nr:hypothetical protein [Myxococcales bacterium]